MNRDNPKIISDETLYKKVFIYDSSTADNRYFRQRIVDFVQGKTEGKSFSQFMWGAVWERNDKGYKTKYCHFNEHNQRLSLDKYFYEWMVRTIRNVEKENRVITNYKRIKTKVYEQSMPALWQKLRNDKGQ